MSVSLREARKLLCTGTDHTQKRQLDKLTRQAVAGITFEAVAGELRATKHSGWSPRYASTLDRTHGEGPLFPWIGSLPLQDITAPLLLHALRRIENRGAHETAHTLRQTSGQVFRCLHRVQAETLVERFDRELQHRQEQEQEQQRSVTIHPLD